MQIKFKVIEEDAAYKISGVLTVESNTTLNKELVKENEFVSREYIINDSITALRSAIEQQIRNQLNIDEIVDLVNKLSETDKLIDRKLLSETIVNKLKYLHFLNNNVVEYNFKEGE